jgi:hypothetical protein
LAYDEITLRAWKKISCELRSRPANITLIPNCAWRGSRCPRLTEAPDGVKAVIVVVSPRCRVQGGARRVQVADSREVDPVEDVEDLEPQLGLHPG